MLKFPELLVAGAALLIAVPAMAQDPAAGETVFKKCAACHAVGEGAKNKIGPELNDLIGRTAGSLDGFKYSKAMVEAGEGGLHWNEDSLAEFLADPRGTVKGTRMAFPGLKKDEDVQNIIAYLKTFSDTPEAAKAEPAEEEQAETAAAPEPAEAAEPQKAASAPAELREGGVFHLGRVATEEEVAAWDIDARPDGLGLPVGSGTVADGEVLYSDQCSTCHGVFGEGAGRWPVLAGGQDTLTDDRPVKTIGSYWPYLSTVYDYVHRAMPFGNARSLSDDDVYAITAYLLYLNDVVTEEDFELSNENLASIRLPNEENFIPDDRLSEPEYAEKQEPCMSDCKGGDVKITMRAQVLDVTPDGESDGGDID